MMKKYNKPEIVTLALEMVDVIETSGADYGQAANNAVNDGYTVQSITGDINNMQNRWTW